MSSKPNVLAVAKLSPLMQPQMEAAFTVHHRLHETDPAALKKIAPEIRAIAGGGESKVSAELIAQLPALEIISIMGVGYDGVDVAAAKARNIPVTHTPDVLNDDVADLAIGLMLSAARQLPAADRYVRAGEWKAKGPMPLARKMSGAKLGIVGMGRIGQAIAQRALGFNMQVSYTARNKRDVPYRYVGSAKELASEVDFLVVITPGGAATKHLINAEVLAALGKKGILVNVARGSVVDEAALVEALKNGTIGGAGLDVFANEPNVPQEILSLPHVVVSPHIGSGTGQTRQAMADLAYGNLKAHFDGKPLLSPVPECR
ncbi:MAG: 2-hydroxyacid dehydrogenase [Burkholderiales bacterium]